MSLPEIRSHVFTPAATPGGAVVRCVACTMPGAEHLDADVIDTYAGARRLVDVVTVDLSCAHVTMLHAVSSVWDRPGDGVWCAKCDASAAIVERDITEAA